MICWRRIHGLSQFPGTTKPHRLKENLGTLTAIDMKTQLTFPLAEAGYYVLPVALVDETLRQNGMTKPVDIHQI